MKKLKLDLATAKLMYESSEEGIKQFALLNYTEEELTKVELPKKWSEIDKLTGYYVNVTSSITPASARPQFPGYQNRNTFPSEEQAKASIALAQLLQLREIYRQGKIPGITLLVGVHLSRKPQHSIILVCGEWEVLSCVQTRNQTFTFVDREICELFLKNFKDLLEEVKPLFI